MRKKLDISSRLDLDAISDKMDVKLKYMVYNDWLSLEF